MAKIIQQVHKKETQSTQIYSNNKRNNCLGTACARGTAWSDLEKMSEKDYVRMTQSV